MRNSWVSRVGMLTLVVGLCLSNHSPWVTYAAAAPPMKDDPHAGLTQNWDKVLPAAQRFVALTDFGGKAVRDNETGLVWEQAPDAGTMAWFLATIGCANKNVGGRKGWRLPSVVELSSLLDPSNNNPALPTGHPFTNVQFYWSATIFAGQAPPPRGVCTSTMAT